MKKFLLGLAALAFITGCSEDESSSSSFNSQIMVDGELFTPGVNADPLNFVMTTLSTINNGDAHARTFHLMNASTTLEGLETLQFTVVYPTTESSVTGTHSFDIEDYEINGFAQGAYMRGTTGFSLEGGSVTVTDLGSNQFKLEFNTVTGTNMQSGDEVTITGYGQGVFHLEEVD